jgi:hypothetical protein
VPRRIEERGLGSDFRGSSAWMNTAGSRAATGSTSAPLWATVRRGVAAAIFVGAALRSFYVLVRGPQRPVADLLMTAGRGCHSRLSPSDFDETPYQTEGSKHEDNPA